MYVCVYIYINKKNERPFVLSKKLLFAIFCVLFFFLTQERPLARAKRPRNGGGLKEAYKRTKEASGNGYTTTDPPPPPITPPPTQTHTDTPVALAPRHAGRYHMNLALLHLPHTQTHTHTHTHIHTHTQQMEKSQIFICMCILLSPRVSIHIHIVCI